VPTYQYACTECGERLEKVQKFSDDPLTVCPACSGRLRKVFSPVGIVFKGSGFYRTDSRNGNGVIAGAKDAKDKSESNGSGSGSGSDSGSSSDSGSGSGSASGSGDKKGASSSGSSASGSSSSGSSSSGSSEKVA
jgi:putative FmdB family regulatory protein